MEDFLPVLMLIIYLFAAASGKKNKAKKKQRGQQKRRQREGSVHDADFAKAFEPAQAVHSPETRRSAAAHVPQADCSAQRLHLHEISQRQMEMAAEGEDPCHAGSAPDAPETADMDNMQDMDAAYAYDPQQDKQALMQDMLRGVIMSEILTRPCDRMATKRTNRRSAV